MNNVLLVYKKSSYHIYFRERGLRPEASGFEERDVARLLAADSAHNACLEAVKAALTSRKIPFRSVYRARLTNYAPHDVVIAVGGDGTFFEAARLATHHRILGVNSDPERSYGFYCRATRETIGDYLDGICAERLQACPLHRLAMTSSDGREMQIMNDVLFAHDSPAALSRYELDLDGTREEQRGSGLWVSTACGSTGAIASAGGKRLPLASDQFQYQPRELSALRSTYRLTGGLLEPEFCLRATSLMRNASVFCDGKHSRYALQYRQTVTFRKSRWPLQVYWDPAY